MHPQTACVGGKHLYLIGWVLLEQTGQEINRPGISSRERHRKKAKRRKNNFLAAPCRRRRSCRVRVFPPPQPSAFKSGRCVLLAGLRIFPRVRVCIPIGSRKRSQKTRSLVSEVPLIGNGSKNIAKKTRPNQKGRRRRRSIKSGPGLLRILDPQSVQCYQQEDARILRRPAGNCDFFSRRVFFSENLVRHGASSI